MKMSGNRLKMSDGTVRHFESAKKRANFERVAEAYKHGWRPGKAKPRKSMADVMYGKMNKGG